LEVLGCKGEKKWCAQGDDFRTFLHDFVASLPQFDFLIENLTPLDFQEVERDENTYFKTLPLKSLKDGHPKF
jgi:hypothetical protein